MKGKYNFFWSLQKKRQVGQTSTEYILLIAVVASLMAGVFDKVSTYFVGNGICPNPSYMCRIIEVYTGPGFLDGSFRYFPLSR